MATNAAEVLIKFRVVGNQQVRSGLKLVETDTKASGQRVTREADVSARTRAKNEEKHARQTYAMHKRLAADKRRDDARATADAAKESAKRVRLEQQNARLTLNAHKQLAAEKRRTDAKSAADEAALNRRRENEQRRMRRSFARETQRAFREEQQQLRTSERLRRQQRTIGERRFAAGVAGVGVVGGAAIGAMTNAQSALGIQSRDAMMGQVVDSSLAFTRTSRAAGLTPQQQAQVERQAIAIGRETNVGPAAVFNAINANQELHSGLALATQGGRLPEYMASMRSQAEFSFATGADMRDVVTLHGVLMRQLSMSAAQADTALNELAVGALDGSLNVADFAGAFPGVISTFSQLRGTAGEGDGAWREFQAVGQALKASDVRTGEDARTLLTNLFASIQNPETRARIEAGGVQTMESDGRGGMRMRNLGAMIAQMSRDSDFQGINLGEIFHDAQARQAVQALIAQEQAAANGETGAMTLSSRENVDPTRGSRLVAETNVALRGSAAGRVLAARANREAAMFENGDELVEAMLNLAAPITNLQDKFPRLTLALEALAPILQALVGAAAMKAMLPGSFYSTLGGNTAPLSGSVINPVTRAVSYPGATAGGAVPAVAAMGGAANTAAIRMQQLAVAVGGFQIGLTGTLGLLDSFQAEGLLGERLQREGGSASQDFAEFGIAKLIAGRYNVGDAIYGSGARAPTQAERASGRMLRNTDTMSMPAMLATAMVSTPLAAFAGLSNSFRAGQTQNVQGPKARDPVVRATTEQTAAVVRALGSVETAVRGISVTPAGRGNTGDTSVNAQVL